MRESMIVLMPAMLATCLLFAVECRAQAPGEVRLHEENDFFNPFSEQTDRYYSQGLRLEFLAAPEKSDSRLLPAISHAAWCSLICGCGAAQGSVNTGYAIGQSIYTPTNIGIARPQPYDHPWAGLLYASRIARVSYLEPSLAAQRRDRIEISLGVVGPPSLAGDAQRWWHRQFGFREPRGWDNQLKTEPVAQLAYETALRWPQTEGGNADVIPRMRANLGNALTSLEADLTVRVGWNLTGFSPPPPASVASGEARRSGTHWLASGNLFLRAGGKAVAHNIVLDGNSFASNDIRITSDRFVPEFGAGVEINLVSNFWMTAQFVHRGSEFVSWRGRRASAQEFGAITLMWKLHD